MRKIALLLSFTAGSTDTLGFALLYQIFTAHVTGNFVLIGSSIAQPENTDQLLWGQLSVLPIFFIAITVASLFIPAEINVKTARKFLMIQSLCLILFCLLGLNINGNINNLKAIFIVTPAIIAMALQNMYSKFLYTDLPFTTVMTGNMTKLAMDFGTKLKGRKSLERTELSSIQLYAVIGFIAGALVIALLAKHIGFYSAIIPALLVLMIALITKQENLKYSNNGK